jgi:hypothetical protein
MPLDLAREINGLQAARLDNWLPVDKTPVYLLWVAEDERSHRVVHIPRRLAGFEFSARHFPRTTRALVTRTGWRRS